MEVLFIADFFKDQLPGGGESNDNNLINYLGSCGVEVVKRNSQNIDSSNILRYKKIIVGNFIGLSEKNKQTLIQQKNYLIYEHDHKYVATRDPSKFSNFNIPLHQIVNRDFYENAQCVVVLSKICKNILQQAIPKAKVHNIGCSLWSNETLDFISSINKNTKKHNYCILKSNNPTKNYLKTKRLCDERGIRPLEIESPDYYQFLDLMNSSECFIFLPTVLETFSRVCAEAKMLNLNVKTIKKLIGFYSEDLSSLQGDLLIESIRVKNQMAYKHFYDWTIS